MAKIMQGTVVERPDSPWMLMDTREAGGEGQRVQGEEVARAKTGNVMEDIRETHVASGGREDTEE